MTGSRALLAEIAVPRLVGTAAHDRVRDVLKRELARRGLIVMEHRFRAVPRFPLRGPRAREGVNLIAVHPRARVRTWLAAHYDSKGQPFSMAGRLVWLGLAGVMLVAAALATVRGAAPLVWWLAVVVLGGAWLAVNTATDGSPGAVDNASGVLAVLAVLDALPAEAGVGALLLDAEEFGLVGARALARERANLLADTAIINLDGLDDRGGVTALVHRPGPTVAAVSARLGARSHRRLPVLVDGMALAAAARECVTLMKGDWSTMRVVHTARDGAERLTLGGTGEVVHAIVQALA